MRIDKAVLRVGLRSYENPIYRDIGLRYPDLELDLMRLLWRKEHLHRNIVMMWRRIFYECGKNNFYCLGVDSFGRRSVLYSQI